MPDIAPQSKKINRQKFYKYNALAQPFLKWAGGKRQLLPAIKEYLPVKFTEYYEPFIGAGAVLFSLQPKSSTLNDSNSELVNCYQVIKDRPEELLKLCQKHQENNSKEYYYQLREQDRQDDFHRRTPVERAARIIYLNKTCFNGLFRVNHSGQFNVPYGKYKNPVIADPAVIRAISAYLNQAQVHILNGDFEQAVSKAKNGSFIYFDPPYHPLSDTSSFTGYSMNGFGEQEQIRLKEVCDRLSDRGCQVLASNSAAPLIKSLYNDPRYEVVEVKATRAINAVASKRGRITNYLFTTNICSKMTKNDRAWKILFEEENILTQIEQNGIFYISSARINEQRQARLMAKFDHAVQLPEIFRKNELSIQPISRSGYIIGHFDSYFNLPRKHSTEVIYSNLPEHIETIDAQNIYSESSAILCAFHSGMISDVIGEEVDITVLSRMSTGIFDYQINNIEKSKNIIVKVKNSQCEIDGGFEGENTFTIIEAKCESVEDFIIRQLYYPYRLWKSKTDKKVIPIFLSISNDIFTFYKFRFSELNVYNSIELVSEHRYCLGSYGVSLSDIRDILDKIKIVADFKNTPFPQADNFSRIVDLLGQLYTMDEPLSKDDITSIYAFDARQTQYYVSAAIYLGLICRERVKNYVAFTLSSKGQSIMAQHPKNRNLELVQSILSHRIFNSSLRIYLEQAEIPCVREVVLVINKGAEKIATASITTQERRAQTVRGWITWILELTTI